MKQGNRLSPLLSGLFSKQLHELNAIGDMRVPEVMYTDDVKLFAVE